MTPGAAKPCHVGIVVKHRADGRRVYSAAVWSARDQRRIRKHFDSLKAAQAWRAETHTKLSRRTYRAPSPTTLAEAAEEWLAGVRDGSVRTRSGDLYKPSAIRSYEAALRGRQDGPSGILYELGARKLHEVDRQDVQGYADRLLATGVQPSTVRNSVLPLRAIFRWKVSRGVVAVNPTTGLDLPAVRGGRDRIASPAEAARLLVALPGGDRPVWAAALYAGLRLGELMGLRWGDVDLSANVIHVRQAWDPKGGGQMVEPKSRAGKRRVPIPAVLRVHLARLSDAPGGDADPDGLVFGVGGKPFCSSAVIGRARRAWEKARLDPIGMHECRHTFASLMIAAGVNAKALSTYMGHANIAITMDRYGHLMPGNEDEAAALLDAYLVAAAEAPAAGKVVGLAT
jgi:integrase